MVAMHERATDSNNRSISGAQRVKPLDLTARCDWGWGKEGAELVRQFGFAPEVVPRILDELDKGDEQTPGVRPVDDEPLDEDARDLLLYALVGRL